MVDSNTISRPSTSPDLLGCRVPPLCLRLHGGPVDGQQVRLESAKVSIGGAAGCTLRLRSRGSLPLYAWILRGPEGCIVRRFVPQVTLNGGGFEEAPLHNGDRLRIGGLELEVVSGARAASIKNTVAAEENEPTATTTLRTDAGIAQDIDTDPTSADPWARSFRRAFSTRSKETSQQRRSLRQHLARRTRKLLESLRRRESDLNRLRAALEQKTADAVRLTAAQQSAAADERVQLEEEARELTLLVEQMSAELREAAAQRAGLHQELGDQSRLRDQVERREAELTRICEEADEVRRSTAAQIEQLKHAFELIRQERDELADRAERQSGLDRQARLLADSLQSELTAALELRDSLQVELDRAKAELAAVEQQHSQEQPQLEQQLQFLRAEIARRDDELTEAREAASQQSQKLIASLDQLREELAELQKVRQNERLQNAAETERLAEELAEQRTLLAQRDAELRAISTSGETQSVELRSELERLQAELNHARQQAAGERSEARVAGQQLEAKLTSLEQQLERRTADWRTSQQTATAEASQFSKTIEQLRSDLQAERSLRQQEVEARQADRRRAEQQLAAARQEAEQRGSELADLHRKLTSENSRLTLQHDQVEREARDLQAKFEAEQTRWTEQLERLQQNVRELTSDCAASQSQLDQVVREASELQDAYAAERARWTEEREQLVAQAEALEIAHRQQIDELTGAQHSAEVDQQVLRQELTSAAEQLRELGGQNEQLRQQVAELQATLEDAQVRFEQLQNQSTLAAASLSDSQALEAEALEEVTAAQERLVEAQRQFEAEKQDWQEQRDAWESGLRHREEELAAHVAELEEQVRQWQARQVEKKEHQIDDAVAALHQNLSADPVYGSYSPTHNELPLDVTMPLPASRGVVELDTPHDVSYGSYGETMPVSFRGQFPGAQEEADQIAEEASEAGHYMPSAEDVHPLASEPLHDIGDDHTGEEVTASEATEEPQDRDSDSVSAVLNRLMQAGLWNAGGSDAAESTPSETPAPSVAGYSAEPAVESHELPPHYEAVATSQDDDMGCTMDAASLMAARGDGAKSWRAQLLGDDPAGDLGGASHNQQNFADGIPAYDAQQEAAEVSAELPSHEEEQTGGLPQQAVGHGSWRAQMLGQTAEHQAEPAEEASPYAAALTADEPTDELAAEASSFGGSSLPPAQPAEPANEDEDSIEAYMSKLLKRVRGDSPEPAWKPAAPTPAPVAEAKPVAAPVAKPKPLSEPVPASEYVPQRQAPEASVSLAAMREIANAASRVAIDTHAKRRHTERFAHRLVKAAMALITTGGFAAWGFYGGGLWAWCGVALGVLLMCWWSAVSVWHMTRAMRLKPSRSLATINHDREVATDEVPADEEHTS